MKKLTTLIILVFMLEMSAWANPSLKNEALTYKVMFKWGLINKQAGTATLYLTDHGNHYGSKLVASSAKWADKFFCVRDTLNGTMTKTGLKPIFYEKIAHEGDEHKHDTVKFSFTGNKATGHCTRKVVKKGELIRDQQQVLEAEGTTVDMLTSYYFMRTLPFDEWKAGHTEAVNIFSGKQKEILTFEYRGIETLKIGKKEYLCYHITFKFTGKGGKKTSDNMDAWITTTPDRTPVQLEGKLPVGKVRCELVI